jgi:hypothetical protein
MGKRFKVFCPVAIALVFSPALLPPYVHHIHFESPHLGDLFSTQDIAAQQETRGQKPETQHNLAEIVAPSDWVARGGCWSFSGNVIAAQGVHTLGRGIFCYNKRTYADFVFEVRLNKLAESGPFGLLIRYDEKKNEGYTYLLFPHGEYRLAIIRGEPDYSLFQEPAVGMNKDTNVWNTIKIVCQGAQFDLYMNDHRLTSITDHTYASGRVGFFLGSDPRQKALFEIVTLKSL